MLINTKKSMLFTGFQKNHNINLRTVWFIYLVTWYRHRHWSNHSSYSIVTFSSLPYFTLPKHTPHMHTQPLRHQFFFLANSSASCLTCSLSLKHGHTATALMWPSVSIFCHILHLLLLLSLPPLCTHTFQQQKTETVWHSTGYHWSKSTWIAALTLMLSGCHAACLNHWPKSPHTHTLTPTPATIHTTIHTRSHTHMRAHHTHMHGIQKSLALDLEGITTCIVPCIKPSNNDQQNPPQWKVNLFCLCWATSVTAAPSHTTWQCDSNWKPALSFFPSSPPESGWTVQHGGLLASLWSTLLIGELLPMYF